MKTFILLSLILLGFSQQSSDELIDVTLEIKSIKSEATGPVYFMLFTSGKGFPKDKTQAAFVGKADVSDQSVSYTFKQIPSDTYAVAAFLDQNKNGKIDSNMIGMPKEPVAASNQTKMAKPSFNRSAIEFHSNRTVSMSFINDK